MRKLPKEFICPQCEKTFPNRYGKISKYCSRECRYKGQVGSKPGNYGKKATPELKKILSDARKRFYNNGGVPWNKGKFGEYTQPPIHGKKISAKLRGISLEEWDGNITPENIAIRMSAKYKAWRTNVFIRDNYTCQECGLRGHKGHGKRVVLNADHIKPFSTHPELRFLIDNGRTLCVECHKKTDTFARNIRYGNLAKNDIGGGDKD